MFVVVVKDGLSGDSPWPWAVQVRWLCLLCCGHTRQGCGGSVLLKIQHSSRTSRDSTRSGGLKLNHNKFQLKVGKNFFPEPWSSCPGRAGVPLWTSQPHLDMFCVPAVADLQRDLRSLRAAPVAQQPCSASPAWPSSLVWA